MPTGLDGVSLAPTLLGNAAQQRPRELMFWEFTGYGGQQAFIQGDWKAVRRDLNRGNTAIELYHLKDDPGERQDLAAARPGDRARLAALMDREHTPSRLFPLPVDSGRP